MTLTTAQGVYALAALAVGVGLWAANLTVGSATRGPDWALASLPPVFRWGLVVAVLGVVLAVIVEPVWIGLGVVYLAGVVAWTARSVLNGLRRLQDAGADGALPAERQATMVGRVGFWLLIVGAAGAGVAAIDMESRGGVAVWDLLLVVVVVGAGVMYRRRAAELEAAGSAE